MDRKLHAGHDLPQPIPLLQMPQLSEARRPDDNWTGTANPAARRKLQNRLNGRAYRRRRNIITDPKIGSLWASPSPVESSAYWKKNATSQVVVKVGFSQPLHETRVGAYLKVFGRCSTPESLLLVDFAGGVPFQTALYKKADDSHPHSANDELCTTTVNPMAGSLKCSNLFPLSQDHLLNLLQFNLVRACISNILSLGFSVELICSDIISPFASEELSGPKYHLSLPPSLQPTLLQKKIPHHPYLDMFPVARVRDNILCAGNNFDYIKLCEDFSGRSVDFFEGVYSGLIVWGEPSDVRNWEVTEAFAKKWSWVFEGDLDLLDATNFWREKRGEPRLVELA